MRSAVEPPAVDQAALPPITVIDVAIESPAPTETSNEDPGGGGSVAMALPAPRATRGDSGAQLGWAATTIGFDTGGGFDAGGGTGTGHGNGRGAGLGLGRGASDHLALRDVPPPPAPHISRARPAVLLHPTRQLEVDDEELFAALVTVDPAGEVVGARITRSHPGVRGDTASSMIWQFRYSPALDDDGNPIRSTFVQTFAVR